MNALVETTNPHMVNGINVDALTALLARVTQDASQGQTTWRVTTTWQGQTRSRADVSGFAIGGEEVPRRFAFDIDEPYELGGSNAFVVAVGFVTSFIAGWFVVKTLLDYVSSHGFSLFVWWRIVVGALGLVALGMFG